MSPDVPEWAMKAATDALNIDVWYEDGRSLLQESVARAILQSSYQAFEETLDAANDYMTQQYGISALGNPIDRGRVKDRLIPSKALSSQPQKGKSE